MYANVIPNWHIYVFMVETSGNRWDEGETDQITGQEDESLPDGWKEE